MMEQQSYRSDSSAERRAATYWDLPAVEASEGVPRLIHQTFPSLQRLPPELEANVACIQKLNPDYEYRLYDDGAIVDYIQRHFSARVLRAYEAIRPSYGAARADLFRYLLLYREGGVYLDIKSTTSKPLDHSLHADDRYILAQWDNGAGKAHEGWGLDYKGLPRGEYQQWHIVASRGHPYLRAVVLRVLDNVRAYRPWRQGVGKFGVFATTGPWAYTDAIRPIRERHPHRLVYSEADVGLRYSIYEKPQEHRKLAASYYRGSTASVVRRRGPIGVAFELHRLKRGLQRRLHRR